MAHFPLPIILSMTIFLVIFCFPICFSSDLQWYDSCGNYFRCGTVKAGFPFWGGGTRPKECGYPDLELSCEYNATTTIQSKGMKYHVLDINQNTQVLKMAREDFLQGICMQKFINTTIDPELFDYAPGSHNLTVLYGCPPPYTPNPSQFTCKIYGTNDTDGYPVEGAIGPSGCFASIVVPVVDSSAAQIRKWSPSQIIGKGFEAIYKVQGEDLCVGCEASKGRCGFDLSKNKISCLCLDGSVGDTLCNNTTSSAKSGSSHLKKELKTTLIIIVLGLALIAVALLSFTRTKASQKLILTKEERKDSHDVEVMLKRYGEYAPKRYTYGEIKKMTSCFQEKLGEGGYGGVYKGKLQDGSPVAVKLLKNPNCKGTDFINEVASISETNHVNIVTLLGYCYQGRKRALVYEFLPNGSLDKYIYCGQNQNSIAWETLLQIVIGIGRGLEYLHQGCRTRILHFDIKPHNILLDAKFCPKISDFGLAKSYVQTKSLMTMSGTRGTPGYIAPEVFCRGFGGASHKSDVYSFGMLVLDLVGCRKNSIAGSEKTSSELYFPHYIYKQFELKEDHELLGISNDEEKVIQKKLVIVSLWCIQTNPSSRPSISRAVEMLEGDIELLQIPPIPSLSSPPKSHHQHDSSTNNATLELQLTNGSSE
ncbi:LEAF RUST 10 DISEASE-RESISTANCE LOCUS RECEPTOR-LIKE PROTEIN KINASE-like 2.4 isoform X4 [Chenopodium quinoa]|uniref:LEAF RUST 10 DISEASE-RESISTANCE LOCUS RECEPTOR-LIKE PROTEIN KINASE-like 2.4 isoform X4 n=1 Tax=Chenopodium quinoa TaxID=63459 RepID=UPI000B77A556|nr:LEAF RUST 10 DISEASE-RESISTANCE LOCUS RECEPTOR-LIKE PROTEIN KINASE-like 2.4 isoform X4 [Chenopodium quinoa]